MATYKPCSILPALAFSLDMFSQTDMSYGVNEVLLASVLGSIVFALAAAQPLVIVGVTGTWIFLLSRYVALADPHRSNHGLQLHRL
jgi:boron transporter